MGWCESYQRWNLRQLRTGVFVAIDAVYRPRNPQDNPLYAVVAGHLATFLARQRERDRNVPGLWSASSWTVTF